MVEVTHEQFIKILDYARENEVSVFCEGATGIGKSEAVWNRHKVIAADIEREFRDWNSFILEDKELLASDDKYAAKFHVMVDIRAATMTETDMVGMPDFTVNKEYVEFKPRLMAKFLSQPSASGCLFMDEINQAPRSVQSSMFKVALDRTIGDLKMSKNISVVAAGNRIEDRASVTEMAAPLATRFLWTSLRIPTADEYIDYNLKSQYPNALITGYLKSYSDQLFTFKLTNKDKAFANPRAVQRLAKIICNLPAQDETDLETLGLLSKASCGDAWGTKFTAYARMARKVDVNEILKNPASVKKYVDQPDMKYSIISAIAYKCKENFKTVIEPGLDVMSYLDEESAVFGLRVIKQYCGDDLRKHLIKKSDVWNNKLSAKVKQYLGLDDK